MATNRDLEREERPGGRPSGGRRPTFVGLTEVVDDQAGCERPADALTFVGRQAVFDRDRNVFAYELLYRSCEHNAADFLDGDQATARVVSSAFMELGLDNVVGDKSALINVTRGFLLGGCASLFPPERVYLEILEDMEVDDELLSRIRSLSDAGYTIVLDDFHYRPELRELVDAAHIIKVEVDGLEPAQIRHEISDLLDSGAKLLAEKVETNDTFEACRDLGFAYFQGFFLNRPQVLRGRRLPTGRIQLFELLARVNAPDLGMDELEELISRNVTLSYRLLCYINSAHFALQSRIESVRHAIVMLGTRAVRTWVSLVALCGIDDKPSELIVTSMVRARMCQVLGEALGAPTPETWFTAGLFSTLDALMDRPMDELLAKLCLSDTLNEALLEHTGPMGAALECVLAYEQGTWDEVRFDGLDSTDIRLAWLDAVRWTTAVKELIPRR